MANSARKGGRGKIENVTMRMPLCYFIPRRLSTILNTGLAAFVACPADVSYDLEPGTTVVSGWEA